MLRNVAFMRPELSRVLEKYRTIRHVLIGSDEVKRHCELYLPRPNAADKSNENKERYNNYKRRAVFYNFTKRTLQGLVGQVFARDPVSEIPDALDAIEDDATGSGVSLTQIAKGTLSLVLSYGRAGILVDYPTTDGTVTALQVLKGEARPTISVYAPESVINWRSKMRGAKRILCLVVIAEAWPFFDDGFEIKTACQFRVLRLDDQNGDRYTVDIYRQPTPTTWVAGSTLPDNNFILAQTVVPTGPNGEYLTDIPFQFVGVYNNDETIDNPPLWELADLNIAHYRNSADYEESCYMIGQPTYWFSGLTQNWVDEVLKGKVQLGAMGGVLLPENGAGGILQPQPNTMVKEAMDMKERQAVALGAKLVEQREVQRTLGEAQQEQTSELSTLSASAKNVSEAIEWALAWCAYFMGMPQYLNGDSDNGDEDIDYDLNSDFQFMNMTAQDRAELIKEWQAGAIAFPEMRAVLRKVGVATMDDDEAQTAIQQEQIDALTNVHTIENGGTPTPGNGTGNKPGNGTGGKPDDSTSED